MTQIETKVTVSKWATFNESALRELIAKHLEVPVEELGQIVWPLNPLMQTYLASRTPPEKELTVYLK